jgi:hypothetical protein
LIPILHLFVVFEEAALRLLIVEVELHRRFFDLFLELDFDLQFVEVLDKTDLGDSEDRVGLALLLILRVVELELEVMEIEAELHLRVGKSPFLHHIQDHHLAVLRPRILFLCVLLLPRLEAGQPFS